MWLDNGWLLLCTEKKLLLANGLIPLIMNLQQNKAKMNSVLDLDELSVGTLIPTQTMLISVCKN